MGTSRPGGAVIVAAGGDPTCPCGQVLRSATDADRDPARVLRAASNDEIDDGAGPRLTAAMLTGLVQGNDQDTLRPPRRNPGRHP